MRAGFVFGYTVPGLLESACDEFQRLGLNIVTQFPGVSQKLDELGARPPFAYGIGRFPASKGYESLRPFSVLHEVSVPAPGLVFLGPCRECSPFMNEFFFVSRFYAPLRERVGLVHAVLLSVVVNCGKYQSPEKLSTPHDAVRALLTALIVAPPGMSTDPNCWLSSW